MVNDLTIMIKNILDMECEHIKKGLITKEFAGNAITAFIGGLMLEGETEDEIKCNRLLSYWSKWCKLYIENVNIEEIGGGK